MWNVWALNTCVTRKDESEYLLIECSKIKCDKILSRVTVIKKSTIRSNNMAKKAVFQFYAELDGVKPKIWRRFQVKSDITVARLGYIVQVLFEMQASHLMSIYVPIIENNIEFYESESPHMLVKPLAVYRYEIPNPYTNEFYANDREHVLVRDATQVKVREIVYKANDMIDVNYDFGDDWHVNIKLESLLDKEDALSTLPFVITGENYGIIESIGGARTLTDAGRAFKKKKGLDYEHYCMILGIETFDIHHFDKDDLNYRLQKLPIVYQQAYEQDKRPTQRSIDIIERKYLEK